MDGSFLAQLHYWMHALPSSMPKEQGIHKLDGEEEEFSEEETVSILKCAS